jgi:hypothetical protein
LTGADATALRQKKAVPFAPRQSVHQPVPAPCMGTANYCKTSGKRGLHIYVPLGGKYLFNHAKMFAEIVARLVHQKMPDITTLAPPKGERVDDAPFAEILEGIDDSRQRVRRIASTLSKNPPTRQTCSWCTSSPRKATYWDSVTVENGHAPQVCRRYSLTN